MIAPWAAGLRSRMLAQEKGDPPGEQEVAEAGAVKRSIVAEEEGGLLARTVVAQVVSEMSVGSPTA